MCLTTTITNFIDKAQTNYARCLFLDFSSAFNTIRVEYLIPSLQHLDSNITQWIISFLSNRRQQTISINNNLLSDTLITNTGTPQGSVLSPLLFSLYTDGIRSRCQNFHVLKYADDTCLIGLIGNPSDLDCYFSEVNRIANQCSDLDLLLNAGKTKEMLFSTKRERPVSPSLLLNGSVISFCESTKYLGVEIDQKLRFEAHIQNVVRKANQRMYIIKNFLYLSTKPLACMLFKSFIVSLIMYCLPVLYPAIYQRDKKDMRKIFKDASSLGLQLNYDLDTLVDTHLKNRVM